PGYVDRAIDAGGGMQLSHFSTVSEWSFGYAFRHLGQDQTVFMHGQDRLPPRQTVHFSYTHKKRPAWIYGDVMFQRQRGAMELMAGMRASYRIGTDSRYTDVYKSSSVQWGVYYRTGDA